MDTRSFGRLSVGIMLVIKGIEFDFERARDMNRYLLFFGALIGLISVSLGALGTHFMEPKIESWYGADNLAKKMEIWNTAVRYMFFHGLACMVLSCLSSSVTSRLIVAAGVCFVAGVILFSGFLFLYVVSDTRWLVHIVPVGGLFYMAGWAALIGLAFRQPVDSSAKVE